MGCTTSKTAVTPSEEQRRPKEHDGQQNLTQKSGWRGTADQTPTNEGAHVSTQHVAATDAELARGHSPASHARTGTHESGHDGNYVYSTSSASRQGHTDKASHKLGSGAATAGSSTVFAAGTNSEPGTSRSAEHTQQTDKTYSTSGAQSQGRGVDGAGDFGLDTEAQTSDLGATSDSESVHEFDEELDANNKVEVIRNPPSVRVNGAVQAGYGHDDARSATTAEYGIASGEEDGSDGQKSRQYSDGGRELSGARSTLHSALSSHSVAADGQGSLHVERHLEVPGGAPQPSPYKQQHKAFGKLTDDATASVGMHSIQEDSSAGAAASGTHLPPPRAPTESRVLRNVQSFRAVTGKAIPRARRDGVIPTESFELHAYHAAQEGAGGPTSPAKFRPKMGAIKSEDEVDFILKTLSDTFLFSHLTESERRRVAHAFEQSSYSDGESIMEQGRLGKTFYILATGCADMRVDAQGQGKVRQGNAFGELALLYDEPRAASIVAQGPCTAWGLNRDAFRAIVVTSAAKTHQQYIGFLRKVPLLKPLREQQLAALAGALTPVSFVDGECIVQQGEEGKVFFIVGEGQVRLTKKVEVPAGSDATGVQLEEEEVQFMVLDPGAHFGEQSLIHESKRQASAYAIGDVSCLALLREDFVTMMGTLKDAMEKAHHERVVKERVATLRATRSFIGSFASIQKANSKASVGGSRRYSGGQGMLDLGAAKPEAKRHPILGEMGQEAKASQAQAPAALAPADVRAPVSGQGAAATNTASTTASGIAAARPKRASMDTITGFRGQIGAPPKPVRKSKGPVGLKLDLSESHTLAADVQPVVPPQPSSGNKVSTAFASTQFPSGPAGAVSAPHSQDTGDGGFGVKRSELQSMSEPPALKAALLREPPSLAGASRAAAGESVAGMRAAIHSFRRVRTDMTLESLQFLAVLGEGAFGQVTLVKHPGTEQVYAMKQMQKARIVKLKQQRNVLNEKSVLMRVREHPYILNLVKTFNTPDSLYMVLEFLQGGDLFGLMTRLGGRLQSRVAMFYAATVTSVLGFLHRRNIVYRDLKPENLVLDSDGFLRVVDFGFAKVVADKTYTLCGTPEYIAPEMVTGKGHGKGVDYWALGVLTYEMLAGYSPFADHAGRDHRTIYKKILRGTFRWSSKIADPALRDLIAQLLTSNPSKRLGCLRGGEDDIRAHAWFAQGNFNWAALDGKQLPPPVVPDVKGPADVSHFEDFKETQRATIVPYKDDGTGWDSGF